MFENCFMVPLIHLEVVKDAELLCKSKILENAAVAADFAYQVLKNRDREYVLVCCVDARGTPVSMEIAAMGGISSCQISIPELFKHAILCNTSGILLFHYHPSGDTRPSREDSAVTKRVKKAGELLGIQLVDHIILSDKAYYSFAENDEMWRKVERDSWKVAEPEVE